MSTIRGPLISRILTGAHIAKKHAGLGGRVPC